MPPTVLILDFGAQYSQLIARRTRELGVYCEIVPYDVTWNALSLRRPAALILSGGPESTLAEGAPKMDPEIVEAGVPILGICYGMQLLARDIGAELVPLDQAEYGPATLVVGDRDDAALRWRSGRIAGVDVARRFRRRAPRRVSRVGFDGALPRRRDRQPGEEDLRRAVSSRSRAHRTRTDRSRQLFARDRRLGPRLEDGILSRRLGAGYPRTCRHRQSDLRALRRGGFRRRRDAWSRARSGNSLPAFSSITAC